MRGRIRPAWALFAIAGAVALLGLGHVATVHWTPRTPIRIAFANSLTGPSSSAGTQSLIAVRLALDEANERGGIGGGGGGVGVFGCGKRPGGAGRDAEGEWGYALP